jgi:AcrR family transcriptional regulator
MADVPEAKRRGRRGGQSGTREQVLAAARDRFARQGYDATTIRQVAGDAGVDPALVHYFFGTKADLFAEVVEYPMNPGQLVEGLLAAGGTQDLGERLLRLLLRLWDERGGSPLFAMIRSASDHEGAAVALREFVSREVVGRIAHAIDVDAPELRATLCGSQIVGLVMVRYVVRVEPLASAPPDELVAWIAPTLQRYLTGPVPAAAGGRGETAVPSG